MVLVVSRVAIADVRIQDAADINLGTWQLSSLTGNDALCVYRNVGGSNYVVTVTDSSTITPSGYYLQDTGTNTRQIPISLYWGNTAAAGSIALSDGVALNGSGANTSRENCKGGGAVLTGNIKVDVNNSAMATAVAGTYTTTVSIRISP